MKKHIFNIREVDKIVFDSIKNGEKSIETRASTPKYQRIETGDTLIFVCKNEKLEKKVTKVNFYKTIDEMIKDINFKKIMPFINSVNEMKKTYYSFPNYKEKIKKFGLVSFELK